MVEWQRPCRWQSRMPVHRRFEQIPVYRRWRRFVKSLAGRWRSAVTNQRPRSYAVRAALGLEKRFKPSPELLKAVRAKRRLAGTR